MFGKISKIAEYLVMRHIPFIFGKTTCQVPVCPTSDRWLRVKSPVVTIFFVEIDRGPACSQHSLWRLIMNNFYRHSPIQSASVAQSDARLIGDQVAGSVSARFGSRDCMS